MDIIRIVGIGLTGAVLSLVVRHLRPELSMMIPLVVTFTVIFCILPYLTAVIDEVRSISDSAGIEYRYINIVFKIIGVSYIAGISAELCKDAGENAIGAKIELAGKLIIVFMSLPVINRLLGIVREIIMR